MWETTIIGLLHHELALGVLCDVGFSWYLTAVHGLKSLESERLVHSCWRLIVYLQQYTTKSTQTLNKLDAVFLA